MHGATPVGESVKLVALIPEPYEHISHARHLAYDKVRVIVVEKLQSPGEPRIVALGILYYIPERYLLPVASVDKILIDEEFAKLSLFLPVFLEISMKHRHEIIVDQHFPEIKYQILYFHCIISAFQLQN